LTRPTATSAGSGRDEPGQSDLGVDHHRVPSRRRRRADAGARRARRPHAAVQGAPPKHFYDTEGSRLFEAISQLPEYYPTHNERAILTENAAELVAATEATELVELGSGVPSKTLLLLDAMQEAGRLDRYVPFDVSETVLRASAENLVETYPGLRVHGVLGDFDRHLDALPPAEGPRIVVFLGGTIGNFLPGARRAFLRTIARGLRPQDRLLLGTDLVKDPAVVEAAYNDEAGVTAAFNRNLLHVVNRELHADFDPEAFEHVAFFDRQFEWIEMRLRALTPQRVRVADLDLTVHFAPREEMRTEISAKFTRERLDRELAASGLRAELVLTDPDDYFALSSIAPA
jgi:L-histidine Nalpha-methyltransferase